MKVLEVLKYPDPFLKTIAEPIGRVDDEVRQLLDSMVATMRAADGIGLAATQVGVGKRVIVLEVPEEQEHEGAGEEGKEHGEAGERTPPTKRLLRLVNPVIVSLGGSIKYEEGCLSIPGHMAEVKRAAEVKVEALDEQGVPIEVEASGLLAVAFQHEIDHLDGILFIERLSRLKRDMIKRKIKKELAEKEADKPERAAL